MRNELPRAKRVRTAKSARTITPTGAASFGPPTSAMRPWPVPSPSTEEHHAGEVRLGVAPGMKRKAEDADDDAIEDESDWP